MWVFGLIVCKMLERSKVWNQCISKYHLILSFITFRRKKKRSANQIYAWICFECMQKDLGSSMCGSWVAASFFPFFASVFMASKPIKDTNFPSFSLFSNQTKKWTKHRKRNWPKTNALQTKQSNWGGKKRSPLSSSSYSSSTTTLVLLRLLFLNSALLILILPDLFFLRWLGVKITNSSLKDKFNSLSGKLNHSLDIIFR